MSAASWWDSPPEEDPVSYIHRRRGEEEDTEERRKQGNDGKSKSKRKEKGKKEKKESGSMRVGWGRAVRNQVQHHSPPPLLSISAIYTSSDRASATVRGSFPFPLNCPFIIISLIAYAPSPDVFVPPYKTCAIIVSFLPLFQADIFW